MAVEKPDTGQANEKLRVQAEALLSQAHAQLADIGRALGATVGDTTLQSRLTALAAQISGAAGQLSQALDSPGSVLRPADLTALDGIVHSNETTTLLTQASAQAKGGAALAEAVVTASAATRLEAQTLSHDLYERKIFDKDLHFGSAEDEAGYRAREAERQQQIAADLAQHTDDGNLHAAIHEAGQLADAGTHGASADPEWKTAWKRNTDVIRKQLAAKRAAGQSTEDDEKMLREELGRSLTAIPAPERTRILAAADPLQAATDYLNPQSAHELETRLARQDLKSNTLPAAAPSADIGSPDVAVQRAAATLNAAGISFGDAPSSSDDGHGLTVQGDTVIARKRGNTPS